jgi:uncharacterized membrane protein
MRFSRHPPAAWLLGLVAAASLAGVLLVVASAPYWTVFVGVLVSGLLWGLGVNSWLRKKPTRRPSSRQHERSSEERERDRVERERRREGVTAH